MTSDEKGFLVRVGRSQKLGTLLLPDFNDRFSRGHPLADLAWSEMRYTAYCFVVPEFKAPE